MITSTQFLNIGSFYYNTNYTALASVGYMQNASYPQKFHDMTNANHTYTTKFTKEETVLSTGMNPNVSYWYADNAEWGNDQSPTGYNLIDPYKLSSTADYPNLVGKYTFFSSQQNTNYTIYYITGVNGTTLYYLSFSSGSSLDNINYSYTYGDSYIDNHDGTFTITNQNGSSPVTIHRTEWYKNYNKIGTNKYMCKNAVNNTCRQLWFVPTVSIKDISYMVVDFSDTIRIAKNLDKYKLVDKIDASKLDMLLNKNNYSDYKYTCEEINDKCKEGTIKKISSISSTGISTVTARFYANSFSWDGTKYTLVNESTTLDGDHHYSCWNQTGECEAIAFIFYNYTRRASKYAYLELTGGRSIEDAIDEMLYRDDEDYHINKNDSNLKKMVDEWYKNYLYDKYDKFIEDTVYCNDRSIRSMNGFKPNNGTYNEDVYFRDDSNNKDLSCPNETDRFSTLNNKAKLTYKVGLATNPEIRLLNNNTLNPYAGGGNYFFLMTPMGYYMHYDGYECYTNVGIYYSPVGGNSVNTSVGVRPVISLVPGIEYIDGDGSMEHPYLIYTPDID